MELPHILSLIIFLPLLGGLIILCVPAKEKQLIRAIAACVTGIVAILGGILYYASYQQLGWTGFDDVNNFQFVEKLDWLPSFGISYHVGIDGFSGPMVMLSTLLCFLAVFVSWPIEKGVKGYFALYLLLQSSMIGVFCALDFFLFYVFWELMLLPMYFLIGIWGGPRREYAAIKFFLYTLAGSVLMLIVMIFLYLQSGNGGDPRTFNLFAIMEIARGLDAETQLLVWWGLFIGFAIKVPIVPFHTWLPDAHVEAPTAVSVLLAGVLLKMGTYGILRFNMTMVPDAHISMSGVLAVIGVVSIIYGAMVAMAQTDFKRMVAYSSVSHMGYVMLGFAAMNSMAINGAVFQMFTHGTSSAMLFMIVGVIYERAHHRNMNAFGGIGAKMPVYYGLAAIGFFAGLGLPGMSGFVSEVFVLIGSFEAFPWLAGVACFGVVLTAGYLLWAIKRVFLGKLNERYKDFEDVTAREKFTLIPLAFLAVILGVFPFLVTDLINGTASELAKSLMH